MNSAPDNPNPVNPAPIKLYSVEVVRKLDSIAINEFKISGYELMKRAGKATFEHLQNTYPLAKQILVCCGGGNNAGDGYVVAKLAQLAGLKVKVISLIDAGKLSGDALTAWKDWHSLTHQSSQFSESLLQQTDVVIDALLGTGLQREVEGEWAALINAINASGKPVIAVDIPSGLCADTGGVAGCAIKASSTITFIGLKKGLFTHLGVDHCGEILFDNLSLPAGVYNRLPAQAELLDWKYLKQLIRPRNASAHKHQHGHVLVLGGDRGMPGAIRMAAEAALRSGAGLVTVVSHSEHAPVLLAGRPELMYCASDDGHVPAVLLSKATAIVIGPGLTDSVWSHNLMASALQSTTAKVIDAGALRLMCTEDGRQNTRNGHQSTGDGQQNTRQKNWVLTPHAGEAGALLGESAHIIQESRFASAELLQYQFGGTIVLKGAGTLVQSADGLTQLCPYGNAGMASAGMGDVLSGIIASLIAQGYKPSLASQLGVCIHALAGDRAAEKGKTGLLATDLFAFIRELMNT